MAAPSLQEQGKNTAACLLCPPEVARSHSALLYGHSSVADRLGGVGRGHFDFGLALYS